MDRVAVAFSGGADSAFLLRAMRDALGSGNVLAATVRSEFSTRAEMRDAARLAKSLGVKHIVMTAKLLSDPKIRANTPLRCYYCKKKIFSLIKKEALKKGYGIVVDASNIDDRKDHRPGRLALKELGILSPLEDAGMTKARIRALSKKIGLPTWDKPANACLATRIPCGETITSAKLRIIDAAEAILRKDAGLGLVRVRCHGDIARIEVPRADIIKLVKAVPGLAEKISRLGFKYVTVDLEGIQMRKKVIFSWSGGKDSALALYELVQSGGYDIAALLTTVTKDYDRISMHGVRTVLLEKQANAIGITLEKALMKKGATIEENESKIREVMQRYFGNGVLLNAAGDIALEDVKKYKDDNLARIGMEGIYPLWKRGSAELARKFIGLGFKAVITCVDSTLLDKSFVGREFDESFMADLPAGVDPCGENGEFHSFVYDGPIFREKVDIAKGEIVMRDNRYYFCDLLPN